MTAAARRMSDWEQGRGDGLRLIPVAVMTLKGVMPLAVVVTRLGPEIDDG